MSSGKNNYSMVTAMNVHYGIYIGVVYMYTKIRIVNVCTLCEADVRSRFEVFRIVRFAMVIG